MSLPKDQKAGLANNANLCLVVAHSILQEVQQKKELSKVEANAMLAATNATLTIALATFVIAFIENCENNMIMRAN